MKIFMPSARRSRQIPRARKPDHCLGPDEQVYSLLIVARLKKAASVESISSWMVSRPPDSLLEKLAGAARG